MNRSHLLPPIYKAPGPDPSLTKLTIFLAGMFVGGLICALPHLIEKIQTLLLL